MLSVKSVGCLTTSTMDQNAHVTDKHFSLHSKVRTQTYLTGRATLRDAPAQAHTRLSHLPTFSSSISQFLSSALLSRPSPPTSYRHSDALWHHRMVEKCVRVSAQHRGRRRDSLRKWPWSLMCESRETLARVKSSLQTEFLTIGLMSLLNLKTSSKNQEMDF